MNGELITHSGNALQRASDMEPQSESAALMHALTQVASNPSFDADKLSKMLEVVRQLKRDEAETAFNLALSELQPRLPRVGKDGHVKYPSAKGGDVDFHFATYDAIDKAIRPLLAEFGFSISFDTEVGTTGDIYIGTLAHKLGHSKISRMRLPSDTSGGKNALQAVGSTDSYARRYLVTRLLNIVTEGQDNDGNSIGFIGENETNKLLDLCMGCDEFKPAGDPDTTESQVLRKYKIKSLSDLQMKRYPEICNALMDRHSQLRKGAAWKPR